MYTNSESQQNHNQQIDRLESMIFQLLEKVTRIEVQNNELQSTLSNVERKVKNLSEDLQSTEELLSKKMKAHVEDILDELKRR
ncbi:hypothetical protein [Risungbinella massiliensis]|uniref:hypothetical protein n=1 Tax=Risungbinella massiliensis TaxID=1329796 RepID=UPI0011C8C5B3|nr:hypothetical protein [Risungbinella massiliensis]